MVEKKKQDHNKKNANDPPRNEIELDQEEHERKFNILKRTIYGEKS